MALWMEHLQDHLPLLYSLLEDLQDRRDKALRQALEALEADATHIASRCKGMIDAFEQLMREAKIESEEREEQLRYMRSHHGEQNVVANMQ